VPKLLGRWAVRTLLALLVGYFRSCFTGSDGRQRALSAPVERKREEREREREREREGRQRALSAPVERERGERERERREREKAGSAYSQRL
jgi:hypothetical protein